MRKICHVEKCMDPIKSVEYCKKEDQNFIEYGQMPLFDRSIRKLKVKDLQSLTNEEWSNLQPREYIVNKKAMNQFISDTLKPFHTNKLRGLWIYGKTGTGKSEYVWDNY